MLTRNSRKETIDWIDESSNSKNIIDYLSTREIKNFPLKKQNPERKQVIKSKWKMFWLTQTQPDSIYKTPINNLKTNNLSEYICKKI